MAMLDRDLQVAQILKDRLSSVVTLVDFKVFGSRARGDADGEIIAALNDPQVTARVDGHRSWTIDGK